MLNKAKELAIDLSQGKRRAIAKSLSLIESKRDEDQQFISVVFSQLKKPQKPSHRVGITGPPGVGKSSFINSFFHYLLNYDTQARVAILTIDPSSEKTGGSLLGDQIRMNQLQGHPRCFIRPSPSRLELGGVTLATYDSIQLFERLEYDYIVVESVGVGQNEVQLSQMVDSLIYLHLCRSGDDLQAAKRGLMETVDIAILTKADLMDDALLNHTERLLSQSLRLLPNNTPKWSVPILTYATSGSHYHPEQILNTLQQHWKHLSLEQYRKTLRKNQRTYLSKKIFQAKLLEVTDPFIPTNTEANQLLAPQTLSWGQQVSNILKKIEPGL